MGTLLYAADCPHCAVQKGSFEGGFIINGPQPGTGRIPMRCGHCGEVLVLECISPGDEYLRSFYSSSARINLQEPGCQIPIFGGYPKARSIAAPNGVPVKIAKIFVEAKENFARGKHETCVFLCGKALDLSTREIDTAWNLEKRIDKLAADGKITQQMAEWAHEIRVDRNDAAHDDVEFSPAEAEEVLGFTEAFFHYLYALPALVKERRKQRLLQ